MYMTRACLNDLIITSYVIRVNAVLVFSFYKTDLYKVNGTGKRGLES